MLWVKQVSRALNTDPFMQAYQGSGNRYCQSSCLLVGKLLSEGRIHSQRSHHSLQGQDGSFGLFESQTPTIKSHNTMPSKWWGDGLQPSEQTCPSPTSPSPYAHKPHSLTRGGFPSALHGVKCVLLHVTLAMEQVLDNFQEPESRPCKLSRETRWL